MNVLGVNVAHSQPQNALKRSGGEPHLLNDGSAALLSNGHLVFAGIEERHAGKRYHEGFGKVLQAFLASKISKGTSELDALAVSSCCGPRWDTSAVDIRKDFQLPEGMWRANHTRLVMVDHHASHASLGFAMSGADKALVAVLDGFGNTQEGAEWNSERWWYGSFHRQTYYIAERLEKGFRLSQIACDAEKATEMGIGEAYRAVTHFCGWKSYQHAGSAMALAAYGDPERFAGITFLDCDPDGKIRCFLENVHPEPVQVIRRLLQKNGDDLAPIEGRTAGIGDREHCSLVRAFQDQVTEAMCTRLLRLAAETGMNTIVISGGVAMNCLAVGELQRRFSGRVFVPPAPSDTGQGLGNAIWAAACDASPTFDPKGACLDLPDAPFWGIPCDDRNLDLQGLTGYSTAQVSSREEQYRQAADMLASGKIIAVCQGRSEYGPRALGGRSILADPRDRRSPDRVNLFKQREPYRPFAFSILQEHASDYLGWSVDSPFMSFAVQIKEAAADRIPAVIHRDGTARVQTVAKTSPSPLRPILERFYALTGVPLLLNTSFNRRGYPIVETPADAVEVFKGSELDALLLESYTICRKESL